MMYAYNKEIDAGGVAYIRDALGGVYFMPVEEYHEEDDSIELEDKFKNVIETTIDVLILAEHLIPLLIRLFLLIFGNKEQKAEARLHQKAAREIAKAQKRWKE